MNKTAKPQVSASMAGLEALSGSAPAKTAPATAKQSPLKKKRKIKI